MALFEKGNNIGNRFTSENQPKKNGRKPSMYKQLKELTGKKVDYELSKEDYDKPKDLRLKVWIDPAPVHQTH